MEFSSNLRWSAHPTAPVHENSEYAVEVVADPISDGISFYGDLCDALLGQAPRL
jgi:hypothetical protein